MRPQHRVALVRPGPRSLAWLEDTLRALKREEPLQPLTVVAPSPYLAAFLRQTLAGVGCANVNFGVQLRPIAERIARASSSSDSGAFDHPLTGPLEAAAIRVALRESAAPVLQRLASNRALHDALGALFRDLGHLPEVEPVLAALAEAGSVGAAATGAYDAYVSLTERFPDVPRQLRIAARLARDATMHPAWAAELGAVVVYLPSRLDDAEQELLSALGRHVPIAAAFAWLDDPLADDPMREMAEALAAALDTCAMRTQDDHPEPPIHVLSAPDPDEEARAVTRRVLADMEVGVALWRIAILYTTEDPYAPLVRETLDAAGLPWHSALGRPAAAGLSARSLLALLGLRERGFAREAVLDWLVTRPTRNGGEQDSLPDVPISAWDRLSRRAQVLEGADQWIARFARLIHTLEFEEQQRLDWHAQARGHEATEEAPRPGRDIDYARAILGAIQQLDRDTRPPAEPASWEEFEEWASSLRNAYVPEDPTWPEAERLASAALDAALDSLRGASELEPTTTIGVFRDTLAAALEARRLDEGRAGLGVLVGPLGSSSGASFDRTYILGMAEGLLPARPPADPLAGGTDAQADPLHRRDRQRSTERRALLAALSGVEHNGAVGLSYSRTDGAARASYPSRWLLDRVARLEGVPALYASDLPRLFGAERPWLERIASAYDGVQRCTTPMNVADLRLMNVVALDVVGRDVSASPLAHRADLVLGRALGAARARRSHQFTEFDGNLGAIALDSRRIARPFDSESGASSATSLERWAGCPFQYFMVNVVRVEATERPEEEWTITALDKGTLVHAALEQFFRERFEQGRSVPDEPFTEADHARLDEIASALLADLEAQGRTGHAVAWENARAALLRDLHMQLEHEEGWRQEEGLAPGLFECTFGDMRDPHTWSPVDLNLGDGSLVRFRGAIDRVDVSPAGAGPIRALVVDYKTGGTWGYDGLDVDPVLAGRHVQLALYARAVRANLSAQPAKVRAEYRFVSSKGKFERRQIVADERTDERLVEVVRNTANGIRAGVFLPMPGQPDRGTFENCRFCDYDRICSTSRDEAWQRKRPNAAFVPLEQIQ